jgi:ATP sulfurylase
MSALRSVASVETIPGLVPPHGGRLIDRWAGREEARAILRDASRFPSIELDATQESDLELIATGAFSPLEGFLGENDLESVVARMRLASGVVWTLPVILAVDAATAANAPPGTRAALRDRRGNLLGVLDVRDRFTFDKRKLVREVFRTDEVSHPGVARVFVRASGCSAGRSRWCTGRARSSSPSTTSIRPVSARSCASAASGRSSDSRRATRSIARTSSS